MGRFVTITLILVALFALILWGVSHIAAPRITVRQPNSLTAAALPSVPATPHSNEFDETGTIVIDQTDGPSGVPYILYTSYNESGKASIATKRLVFANEPGCQASALPCATRPATLPVDPGTQVHIVGEVDAQNVLVSNMEVLSGPAVPQGS